MKTFVSNSHTLHKLMLALGVVFKVEEEKPYKLYNEDKEIAFLPPEEYIPDDHIVAVPDFATELQELYVQTCNEGDYIQLQLPKAYPIDSLL